MKTQSGSQAFQNEASRQSFEELSHFSFVPFIIYIPLVGISVAKHNDKRMES